MANRSRTYGDLVVSVHGVINVVVQIHPDGRYGWRVGEYRLSPIDSPRGLAVFGVRDGAVQVATPDHLRPTRRSLLEPAEHLRHFLPDDLRCQSACRNEPKQIL